MNNDDKNLDLLRLNALADGELLPAERAQIAARMAADRDLARGYATLARLKACVMETAENAPAVNLPVSRPMHPRRAAMGFAAAAAVILVVCTVFWGVFQTPRSQTDMRTARERAIMFAALPAHPVIPDFGQAGLTLIGVELRRQAAGPVLVAAYTGPRGCRLELRIRGDDAASSADGSSRHGWTAAGLSYELVAFGMPATRFALIVGSAERQTRIDSDPGSVDRQLREARSSAPPCVG